MHVAVYLEFLLYFYCAHANNKVGKNALQMVGETLIAIDRGGIHDHIREVFVFLFRCYKINLKYCGCGKNGKNPDVEKTRKENRSY